MDMERICNCNAGVINQGVKILYHNVNGLTTRIKQFTTNVLGYDFYIILRSEFHVHLLVALVLANISDLDQAEKTEVYNLLASQLAFILGDPEINPEEMVVALIGDLNNTEDLF